MQTFKQFLREAISLDKARKYRDVARAAAPETYRNKGKRVILPDEVHVISLEDYVIGLTHEEQSAVSVMMDKVSDFIELYEYSLGDTFDERMLNYFKNFCYRKDDMVKKRPVKISKVLETDRELLRNYINDRYVIEYKNIFRLEQKKESLKVLVTDLYLDVAGMSTDKKWTSCMNLGGYRIRSGSRDDYQEVGAQAEFVESDVARGSKVAYLIKTPYKSLDAAIDDSIARITIRPHNSAHEPGTLCWVPGPIFGVASKSFKEIVLKYVDSLNSSTVYEVNPDLYDEKQNLDDKYKNIDHVRVDIAKGLEMGEINLAIETLRHYEKAIKPYDLRSIVPDRLKYSVAEDIFNELHKLDISKATQDILIPELLKRVDVVRSDHSGLLNAWFDDPSRYTKNKLEFEKIFDLAVNRPSYLDRVKYMNSRDQQSAWQILSHFVSENHLSPKYLKTLFPSKYHKLIDAEAAKSGK